MNEVIQFLMVVVLSIVSFIVLPMMLMALLASRFIKKEPIESSSAHVAK